MHEFDIQPYEGALPLSFGMSVDEVHAELGRPDVVSPIWDGSGHSHYWLDSSINLGFDNSASVTHFGFVPGAYRLTIRGLPIWSSTQHGDPNPLLLTLDPQPVECVGFLVFLGIGVTTTGYHDDDPAQHALTAFRSGDYDDMKTQATEPDLSRYR